MKALKLYNAFTVKATGIMRTITTGDIMKTALRLPRALHEELHRAAKVNQRSLNTEIVERLRQSLNDEFMTEPGYTTATELPVSD